MLAPLDPLPDPTDAAPADGLVDASVADAGPPDTTSPCDPTVAAFDPSVPAGAVVSQERTLQVGARRYRFEEVLVPPGTACLGQRADQCVEVQAASAAPHEVTLTRGYFMQRTEVTQALWNALAIGPSLPGCDTPGCPAGGIGWLAAVRFANALSERMALPACYVIAGCEAPESPCVVTWPEQLDCGGYRLPTEAEWEYAARGGRPEPLPLPDAGCPGADEAATARLARIAWFADNADGATHPVGTTLDHTHPLGLQDMLGNVAEWTFDWFQPYPAGPLVDPIQTEPPQSPQAPLRVRRGGGFDTPADHVQVADRNRYFQVDLYEAHPGVGLRLVRTAPPTNRE